MGKQSQRRGKYGEWELARTVDGIKVSRPRKRGIDVVSIKRAWFAVRTWEVKRVKSGIKTVYNWVRQAKAEGADAVAVRADGEEWLVIMPLSSMVQVETYEMEGEEDE